MGHRILHCLVTKQPRRAHRSMVALLRHRPPRSTSPQRIHTPRRLARRLEPHPRHTNPQQLHRPTRRMLMGPHRQQPTTPMDRTLRTTPHRRLRRAQSNPRRQHQPAPLPRRHLQHPNRRSHMRNTTSRLRNNHHHTSQHTSRAQRLNCGQHRHGRSRLGFGSRVISACDELCSHASSRWSRPWRGAG